MRGRQRSFTVERGLIVLTAALVVVALACDHDKPRPMGPAGDTGGETALRLHLHFADHPSGDYHLSLPASVGKTAKRQVADRVSVMVCAMADTLVARTRSEEIARQTPDEAYWDSHDPNDWSVWAGYVPGPEGAALVELNQDLHIGRNEAGEMVATDTLSVDPGAKLLVVSLYEQEQLKHIGAGYVLAAMDAVNEVDIPVLSWRVIRNHAPVADAGPDQAGETGEVLALSGIGSSDADGDTLTYRWKEADGNPAAGSLSEPTSPTPTLTPAVPGTYRFVLEVDDGISLSAADGVVVTVSQANRVPVADAGLDRSGVTGEAIAFDGSGSRDADGDALTFLWLAESSIPASSGLFDQFDNTATSPTFTPLDARTYRFSLVVNDGQVDSDPDEFVLTIEQANRAPIASAGRHQSGETGETFALDGSYSSDRDDDPLTYLWTEDAENPETGLLPDPTAVSWTLAPTQAGVYRYFLVVSDGEADSPADEVLVTVTASALVFVDANLEAAVREAIDKLSGEILASDVADLIELGARERGIANLEGIENLTGLTNLDLRGNELSDIGALSSLTQLTELSLYDNQISDVSALSSLTQLTWLNLRGNQISDISALSDLAQLTTLVLISNQVSDIGALSSLSQLSELWLRFNQIRDISALSTLTQLTGLGLGSTQVSDIGALSSLTQLTLLVLDNNQLADIDALSPLTQLTYLSLNNTQVSDLGPLSSLTQLNELWLLGNQLDDISSLSALTLLTKLFLDTNQLSDVSTLSSLTQLTTLRLSNNQLSGIDPLSSLMQLSTLWLQGNQISDLSPLVANNGIDSGDTVNLRDNPLGVEAYSTHIPAMLARGVEVEFDEPMNTAPISDAGDDQSGEAGVQFTLDGSGSSDADGDQLSYVWAEVPGNPATGLLSELTEAERVFTSTVAGPHRFVLVVNDGQTDSAPDTLVVTVTEPVLVFADVDLEAAVRGAIGKPDGDILASDVQALGSLNARSRNIANLAGIERLPQLAYLYLQDNPLTDLSPLSGSTHLVELELHLCPRIDLATLSPLTQVTSLALHNCEISDLSPLSSLTQLTGLYLSWNQLSDLSPLSDMVQMTQLTLSTNQIGDLSPLSSMTQLTRLELNGNQISDLSPLVANGGLDSGDTVDLLNNPLNAEAYSTHIPALQARGVQVAFDVPVVEVTESMVVFADANLEAAVRDALRKPDGDIAQEDAAGLTTLAAGGRGISDLSGIEKLPNLTQLILFGNQISDLLPLSSLIQLTALYLSSNQISDPSPLMGLPQLMQLDLRRNQISDLSSPSGLTQLTWLDLGENQIGDPSSLSGLTQLAQLRLDDNLVSDLSSLSGLNQLTQLWLGGNQISDLPPLSGLNQLVDLDLRGNEIIDLSPLSALAQLMDLELSSNQLIDLSPLSGLTQLTHLNLYDNKIIDMSPLSSLTQLADLGIGGNQVIDLSPLSGMTQLTQLSFFRNHISDLSPLVANNGMDSGDTVDLRENPLGLEAYSAHIPALQARGVEVYFDELTNFAPIADAGADQHIDVGQDVVLDGSNSDDADGLVLTYAWTEDAENPVTGVLSDATAVAPSFTPVLPGEYRFALEVNDGQADSVPDEVVVTVIARLPADLTVELPGGATMEFMWIEAGTFTMGSPETEEGRQDTEGPQHEVTISEGFYLGRYEITQEQWQGVMGTMPSGNLYAGASPSHPVAFISWDDVQEMVSVLNTDAGEETYRLPTEAEWEYACRAGTTTRWSFGDERSQVGEYAWYYENAQPEGGGRQVLQPVGRLRPNPWGLYDMHGNVGEWVQDWLGFYSSEALVDPQNPFLDDLPLRVTRGAGFSGGGLGDDAFYTRSAFRGGMSPGDGLLGSGARLLRTP